MKTLVYLFFLVLCLFALVGWFMDWYHIVDLKTDAGKHRVQIDFDMNKIRDDFERGAAKFQQTVRRVSENSDKTQPPAPVSAVPVEVRAQR
jgi:hypothetical protein